LLGGGSSPELELARLLAPAQEAQGVRGWGAGELRASTRVCLGEHWSWQAGAREGARGLPSGGAAHVRPGKTLRSTQVELMVPPRTDLPSKGLVAGRGRGGGAGGRVRGGASIAGVLHTPEASAGPVSAESGGEEVVVAEGAEELARLEREVVRVGAWVSARRDSRQARLRAVAEALSLTAGVTWRGLPMS